MTDLHTRIAELAANESKTLLELFDEVRVIREALPEILTTLRIAERVMDEDWLANALIQSMGVNDPYRDGARAIIAALKEPT